MELIILCTLFFIGASFGSLTGVLQYRMCRDISLISPRSFCENCKKTIAIISLIPFFGYFFSLGKCRNCGSSIPVMYPVIEGIWGLVISLSYFITKDITISINLFIFFFITASLSLIDLKCFLVPDKLLLAGSLLFFAGAVIIKNEPVYYPILGAAAGFIPLFIIHLIKPDGMGLGDPKYAAMIGMALGWKGALIAVFFGVIIGGLFGVFLLLTKKASRKTEIPFIPFLTLGAWISWFFSRDIWNLYFL